MKINSLSPAHEGFQPVRVLQYNITYQFETTNPTFVELSKTIIKDKGLKPGIRYYIYEKAIMDLVEGYPQTPYVNLNGVITLHETFLSYVWGICYSMLVLYEEAIAKSSQNIISKSLIYTIDQKKIDKANELFKYSISLINNYTIWDKDNLPNPEDYYSEDAFFVGASNGLFVYAMNFILCHEFAHVEMDHISKIKKGLSSISHILDYEKGADQRAMELVLCGTTPETKLSAELGILIGMASILFFKNKTETSSHPATDDRMHLLIENAGPDPADPHWGIALLAFKLWEDEFDKDFTWPQDAKTLKDMYLTIKKEIEDERTK